MIWKNWKSYIDDLEEVKESYLDDLEELEVTLMIWKNL